MSNKYNDELLLTRHNTTPIRFYLHRRNIDLSDIKTNFHNRITGIDKEGKNQIIHKDDILFTFPLSKLDVVEPYLEMLKFVEDLRLDRKTKSTKTFCINDLKLQTLLLSEIDLVTRRGHVIQGILEEFDKDHLFIQTEKEIILVYRKGLLGLRKDVVASLNCSSSLDELRTKRKKWVEVNRENNFEDGIKHLLTELYPDNAHFIYELLQNAEDAGASAVQFILDNDRVTFEHNGDRLFSFNDVEAITSIGFSSKKDDHTNIGKFGIGFKAVYAYTATPEIESGEFHFCIRDMVIPDTSNLFQASLGEEKTRFIFPFDNPKKPSEKAYAEIEQNLQQLNHGTLLFLSNIRRIEFQLPNSTTGILEVTKKKNNDRQIEIAVKHPNVHVPVSIHYLRFEKVVSVIDEDKKQKECKVAVAFGMRKNDKGEWKVKSLNPGQVFIYFPAANETSNLKFHLHAPFASTVARDSVRESPANDELRNHISDLIAESMTTIRDRGMLDVEFLATLPNDKEHIPTFYQPILKRIVEEFNTKNLVPMKLGRHAIASESYRTARGERILSDLINDQDLATLLEIDRSSSLWIANPPQINQREDNFLSMLDISGWTIENLIEVLRSESDIVMEWLKQKDNQWHQNLYALLYDSSLSYTIKSVLKIIRIVRCEDGIYRLGSECHFSGNDSNPKKDLLTILTEADEKNQEDSHVEENQEENFYYVSNTTFSSGNNKKQQESARKFLETIGVKEVDETEKVKAILKQRYKDSIKPRDEDMKRFINLIDEKPETKSIFKDYYIFEIDLQRENKRLFRRPSGVFVDSPYIDTGLGAYYEIIDEDSDSFKRALSPNYTKSRFGIIPEDMGKFAEAVGAQTKLEVTEQSIPFDHPQREHLYSAPGEIESRYCINRDFVIPELEVLLGKSITKSKLIWQTMRQIPEDNLETQYRKSASYESRYGYSSLVHQLKNKKWVPQKDSEFTSFVRPCNASIDKLPEGFPYEPEQKWLNAIEFGKKTKEQKDDHAQRNQNAKEFGYDSGDEAEEVAVIYKEWKAQGKSPEELHRIITQQERRRTMLIEELDDSPDKEYEQRARNVRVSRGRIDPVTPLRTLYALDGNNMNCQMCKHEMPFKKCNSDDDYFEAVEGLRKDHFPIEHEAQYLALCPECSAKYKEYVKKDRQARNTLYNALKDSDVPEVSLHVNGETIQIWFEEKHWHDLKTVIYYYENKYSSENSTD